MVEIFVHYQGELHTTVRHGPSGSEIETDAPVDNQGRGESFSPTDMLASALGCCMCTVMGIVARRKGWPLEGTRVRVEKHMSESPRRVGRLLLRFEMPAGLPDDSHASLEEAARTCPVAQSIHPEIDLDVTFEWA
jgi:putative redox protein